MVEIFHDYAFVVKGRKRSEVLKLLAYPRTPTELSKMLQVHANVITRILKDLFSRSLIEYHDISGNQATYRLTKKGDLARCLLDNLVEPKSLQELVKLLKLHRGIVLFLTKHLIKAGFVTIFKTIRPARKFCQLTKKGEAVKEKIETY